MADGFRRKIFLITFWILLILETKPIVSVSYNFISGNLRALLRSPRNIVPFQLKILILILKKEDFFLLKSFQKPYLLKKSFQK